MNTPHAEPSLDWLIARVRLFASIKEAHRRMGEIHPEIPLVARDAGELERATALLTCYAPRVFPENRLGQTLLSVDEQLWQIGRRRYA